MWVLLMLLLGQPFAIGERLVDGEMVSEIIMEYDRAPTPAVSPPAIGERSAAVIVVDFLDAPVTCTDQEIAGKIWHNPLDNIDELFQEVSFGALSFPPDTNGDGNDDVFRVQIPFNLELPCAYLDWTAAANELVSQDLSIYQHKMYVFPALSGCWTGLGSVNCGNSCRHWVWRCNEGALYSHETGHNLGMKHAATDLDNDGIKDYEYGDNSCTMGGRWWLGHRRFNAAHAEQMGWMDAVDIAADGVYIVHAVGSPGWPQAFRTPKPGSIDWYYISFRNHDGYDETMPTTYADRVSVHRYAPTDNDGVARTYLVQVLEDGDVFLDNSGVVIEMLSHTGDNAMVEVTLSDVGGRPALEREEQSSGINEVQP